MTQEEQLEYFGYTEETWVPSESYEWEVPEWFEKYSIILKNPFTDEEYQVDRIREASEVETTLRKSMVQHEIMESDDISLIDLQWVSFSDQEIGDIIVHRVFGGNPHAQMAMMAKVMSIMMKQMMWETPSSQEMEILAKSEESKTQINEIRAKFNLQVIS